MSGEPKTLTLTFDEFEATAKRITHQWMRHVGYKQPAIDGAEQLVDDDTPIDIDDPAADAIRDLLDSSELVVFVMERLAGLPEVGVPVVARDEAAELRAGLAALIEKYKDHFDGTSRLRIGDWASHHELAVLAIGADLRRLAGGESDQ